jgi:hypothetical protein
MTDEGSHSHGMKEAGIHTHEISGGDGETRPKNKSVNCIVKAIISPIGYVLKQINAIPKMKLKHK